MISDEQKKITIGSRVKWGAVGIPVNYGVVVKTYGQQDDVNNGDFAILVEKEESLEREMKLASQVQAVEKTDDDEEGEDDDMM